MAMTKYLLDTNVCIALFKHDQNVIDKILSIGNKSCHISEITIAELLYGASKSGRKSHFDDVKILTELFEIVPIYPALRIYGETKAILERQGNRIDDFDLLIGASALYNSFTLVTHNVKHFARIKGLAFEDWENQRA